MNVKFLQFAFIMILLGLGLSAPSAHAQDKGLSPQETLEPNHADSNSNDEKMGLNDHESRARASRDSMMVMHIKPALQATHVPKSKLPDPKPSAEEEEDALSFNFLYYIIQKFKFSDLIDE
jgi:hypothetical protein